MMNRLKEFFQDAEGLFSANRLVFITFNFVLMGIWAFVCIVNKTIVPLDQSIISLVAILMAGKVTQSLSENFSPK